MGPETIEKINNYQGDVLSDFYNLRRNYIDDISKNSKRNKVFQKGWQNRIDEMERITAPEETSEEVEKEIDRVNIQQSSGENTPLSQLDSLLEKINRLQGSPEEINELENDAVQMETFADGQRLKEKIRRLQGLS